MPQWQKIEVPRGSYVGWGNKRGQHVTGTVTDYDVTGGSDFNGNACPQLDVELTERAASFDKEGNRTNFEVGELVSVTCGLTVLKKMVKSAEPKKGDLVKITMDGTEKSPNGTVKLFDFQIARGVGDSSSSSTKSKASDDDLDEDEDDDDEPPF